MLDKYFVGGPTHNTHVNVKQAGLHDATKNYKEFRDDAEKQAAKLELAKFGADNCVRYLRAASEHEYLSGNQRVRLVFDVNGKIFDISKVFDRLPSPDRHQERRLIAEAIAAEIVTRLMDDRDVGI